MSLKYLRSGIGELLVSLKQLLLQFVKLPFHLLSPLLCEGSILFRHISALLHSLDLVACLSHSRFHTCHFLSFLLLFRKYFSRVSPLRLAQLQPRGLSGLYLRCQISFSLSQLSLGLFQL